MSDRKQRGLRGSVKTCTEESTYPGMTDSDGRTYPEVHSEYTSEFDEDGRMVARRSRNSDGSQWTLRYYYDASGRLQKASSGGDGSAFTETTYSYDQQGRLQEINSGNRPVSFRYDGYGRKTKVETSSSADYRPNSAVAGSPFEVADRAPNLPGGGTATTIYDEYDRPTEVQVRDANGLLVNRALRTYNEQGNVVEEAQILDNPERMIPSEARAKLLEESGFSEDQLAQELRNQLTQLMAGQPGPYSVSYRHDTQGRVVHTSRRIFNREQEIETTYNERGDIESETTRSKRPVAEADSASPDSWLPSYSEVRYSYRYDQNGNWIEKAVSHRSRLEAAFQSSTTTIKRNLTYY